MPPQVGREHRGRLTLMQMIAREDEHPALIVPGSGDTVSYADLHAGVHRIARELAGAGVLQGDAVAMTFANCPEMVICFLAIASIGAAAAPLNPLYTAEEYRGYLSDLRPSAMIFHGGVGQSARRVCSGLDIAILDATGDAARLVSLGGPLARAEIGPADPDDVALLLHTSGTTGRPKVVPLRQRNLAASSLAVARSYQLSADDVSHCVMPLFHVHGLVASALATVASGGTVLVPLRFSAPSFWRDTVAHGASWFSAVPTFHQVLSARAERDQIPAHGLRFARSCSSALPGAVQARLEAQLGVPVLQAYGMTEAAHQMASNPLPPGERRPGSVGRATDVELAIVDDEWRPCPDGEAGEVVVRGPSVVDGYRDNPEANEASFREGWFRTGDVGRLSDDGYLTLDGRLKELINRGGEKISPHEIEGVLLRHPAVAEAVAYGVPDQKYGEQVAVAVVARAPASERELREHCARSLAGFKVPVTVTTVTEIPKGPTGKIQRRLLAELIGQ
jgi:acyl-CoA synthetase (AMP-forming)/AMP-acid ligase II